MLLLPAQIVKDLLFNRGIVPRQQLAAPTEVAPMES
jgi:hypothetical protein